MFDGVFSSRRSAALLLLCAAVAHLQLAEAAKTVMDVADNAVPTTDEESDLLFQKAQMYINSGKKKSLKQAVKILRRTSEQDHAKSQVMLGELYRTGKGVALDYQLAVEYYRLAAEHPEDMVITAFRAFATACVRRVEYQLPPSRLAPFARLALTTHRGSPLHWCFAWQPC